MNEQEKIAALAELSKQISAAMADFTVAMRLLDPDGSDGRLQKFHIDANRASLDVRREALLLMKSYGGM